MKKILALTFAIIIAAALIAAPLTVPSYAWGSPGADLQQPGELELVDQFPLTDPAVKIALSGDSLFTVRNSATGALLQALDVTLPGAPQVSDSVLIDSTVNGEISISGSFLYLPTTNGVTIVDFADPGDLQTASLELGYWDHSTVAVDAQSDRAVALTIDDAVKWAEDRLTIIDVADPLNPVLLGKLSLNPGSIENHNFDLSLTQHRSQTVAYITSLAGWWVVDVSDPAEPLVLFQDSIYYGSIETVAQGEGITAYMSYPNVDALVAVDVSDPANPVTRGVFKLGYMDSWDNLLMADGAMVYFANPFQNRLILVDFSQPEQPVWIGNATLPEGQVIDAGLSPDTVAVLSGTEVYFFANISWLEGRVTDHNITPVEGVTLALSNGDTALTGPDGLYAFPDLLFGSYAVTPTLDHYVFVPPFAVIDSVSGWQSFIMLAPPVSTTLEPGLATTLTYTDGQGLPTSFIFPAGLVSTSATATVTPTLANWFFGMDFAGHAFDLSVRETGSPTEILTFTLLVSVTIRYSPMDVAVIPDTMLLALYRQEGDSWVKIEDTCSISPTPVPVEAGVFQTAICQGGRYALFGPTHAIALPEVIYGSDTGEFPPP